MRQPTSMPPRFGVNYTPRTGWFHHWLDFDLDAVRADLDAIAALGVDHVRMFAVWPLFQPNRGLVRPAALRQLGAMVDAAAERGLDVSVDGLQGHLSSFDFVPSWATTWHRQNLFTADGVVAGQAAYLTAIARELAGRPNFLGMSVGNEFSQFAGAQHPEPSTLTVAEAEHWLRTMLAACTAGAPHAEHHHSEYDAALFDPQHPFTPQLGARHGARTTVHSWIFNGTARRYGGLSEQSVRLAAYLVELARAYGTDPHREVWLQEIGAPAPHVSAAEAPEFARRTLEHVLDCHGLYGVTWWCSHDVGRELLDFPELEYSLGLIDQQQRVKATGSVVAAFAGARSALAAPAARAVGLVLEAGATSGDDLHAPLRATCAPGGAFFEAWMDLAIAGHRPAVVLAPFAADPAHLTARGITHLIQPAEVHAGT
ncbi:glycoside hydrolase 5 family protein [Pseudonocardia sp. GCM10023141]|uniref:glycoside hydrolase 5 family protein n=1 Tax=Pseudonocardia sp. GCM10023141 TaxID=3252653 RepID=UPI003618F529